MPSLDQTMERVLALAARGGYARRRGGARPRRRPPRSARVPGPAPALRLRSLQPQWLSRLRRGSRRPGTAAAAAAHRRTDARLGRGPGARRGAVAARGAGRRDRPWLAPAGRRDARGRQPDRHARRRAGAPLDRGPPRHQGADSVDGRTAGGGVGHRHGGRGAGGAGAGAPRRQRAGAAGGHGGRGRGARGSAGGPRTAPRHDAGSERQRDRRGGGARRGGSAGRCRHRHPDHRCRGVRAGRCPRIRRPARRRAAARPWS